MYEKEKKIVILWLASKEKTWHYSVMITARYMLLFFQDSCYQTRFLMGFHVVLYNTKSIGPYTVGSCCKHCVEKIITNLTIIEKKQEFHSIISM